MDQYESIMDEYLNTLIWKGALVNWDDECMVKEIIYYYIDAFKKVSPRLRDDPKFVRDILDKCGYQLMYVSERLRDDANFVRETVNKCIGALEYGSPRLLDDNEFMKTIIETHACAFRFASERLRNNYSFVEFAIRRRGSNLQYTQFTDNEVLARLALERPDKKLDCPGCEACCLEDIDLNVLQYLNEPLQLRLIDLALEHDYNPLIHPSHCDDPLIVQRAIQKNYQAFKQASRRLKHDLDFIKTSVTINGYCLQFLDQEFTDNIEIVQLALQTNPEVLIYASIRLQNELDNSNRS